MTSESDSELAREVSSAPPPLVTAERYRELIAGLKGVRYDKELLIEALGIGPRLMDRKLPPSSVVFMPSNRKGIAFTAKIQIPENPPTGFQHLGSFKRWGLEIPAAWERVLSSAEYRDHHQLAPGTHSLIFVRGDHFPAAQRTTSRVWEFGTKECEHDGSRAGLMPVLVPHIPHQQLHGDGWLAIATPHRAIPELGEDNDERFQIPVGKELGSRSLQIGPFWPERVLFVFSKHIA